MRAIKLILVFLATVGGILAKAENQTGGGSSEMIIDYLLENSRELGDKIAEEIDKNEKARAACFLPDGSSPLGIRRLYDTIMLMGEVLCNLRVTCFTRYARDIFPLPISPGDLNRIFASSSDVLLVGRWYQVYAPLMRLGETYTALLANQAYGDGEVEPFAIVIYPDIEAGEERLQVLNSLLRTNLLPAMGDRDVIEKLVELLAEKIEERANWGNRGGFVLNVDTLWQLLVSENPSEQEGSVAQAVKAALKPMAIPWPRSDRGDSSKQGAEEAFFRTLQDAFPGFIVAISRWGLTRIIIIVGSSVPDAERLFQLDGFCAGEGQGSWNRRGENYFELVGRVPYGWGIVMRSVLPMMKTVVKFADQIEGRDRPFPRDNGRGGVTAP